MTLEPGHLITLGFAAVAVIIWLVRLEGRVNGKATSDQIGSVSSQIAAVAGRGDPATGTWKTFGVISA